MNESKSLFHFLAQWWEQRAQRNAGEHRSARSNWLPTPGNILFTLLIAGLLIFTQRTWANNGPNSVNAPGPSATTINYQGRLADSNGNPINGNRTIQFAIYDAASSGNVVWGAETHANVPVTDGLFNVGLGSLTPGGIPTTVWNGDRYLQITVNGEALSPRELIRSVPIAGMALTVPDRSIGLNKMNISILQPLGNKTCGEGCPAVTETVNSGWRPVKGQSVNDTVEVTVTTHGGPVWVHMTAGIEVPTLAEIFCGVRVLQNGNQARFAHLDGSRYAEHSRPCSGTWLFPDLPAGTYTFQAMGFTNTNSAMYWIWQRQIAVYEFLPAQ